MMTSGVATYKPQARANDLVTQDLADQLLVYDVETQKAHCLNGSAAAVWGLCDGRTTISQIVARLTDPQTGPVNEEIVWVALDHLSKAGLLTAPVPVRTAAGISRRKLMQKLTYAAMAVPLVSSIVVPAPSDATSGVCGTAPCTACHDLSSSAVCVVGCEACLGTCCQGGGNCRKCALLTGGVSCDACKFGIIAGGMPGCTVADGATVTTTLCSCDSNLQGTNHFIYGACTWQAT